MNYIQQFKIILIKVNHYLNMLIMIILINKNMKLKKILNEYKKHKYK